MNAIKLLPIYLRWHYSTAFVDMFGIIRNIFWFLWHFFSVSDTLRTFFSTWKRFGAGYKKLGKITAFLVDVLMLIFGVVMRTVLLFFYFISFVIAFIVVCVSLFIWVFIPFILTWLAVAGFSALFN